jgi:hypothetical protein
MHRLALLALVGCSSARSDALVEEHAPATAVEAIVPTKSERPGSTVIDMPGDGNGAYWDANATTLFVTDATHDGLAAWTRDRGFAALGTFPAKTKHELGGIVRLSDGRFLVTSFGFGTEGTIYVLEGTKSREVAQLDPKRRRIAIAAAPDGQLFVTYFVVMSGSKRAGGVARLDVDKGETEFAGELAKPVGLAVTADTLFVAEEESGAIIAIALADPAKRTTIAEHLPGVDHLMLLPNGDLVTGGKRGVISRITPRGTVTTVADGFEQVRGLAYDSAGKRLFVVEHSSASSRHKLHVLPLI